MSDQDQKLKEAEFFYGQMLEAFRTETYEAFTFLLSAFLSSARSILQYTHDRATAVGRVSDYNRIVSGKPSIRYFKDKRDANIHVRPVVPIQQVDLDVRSSITIGIRESVRIQVIEANGTISRDETHDSPAQDPVQNQDSDSITRTLQYRFDDWPGDEDVLKLANQYLKELRTFIQSAKSVGLI